MLLTKLANKQIANFLRTVTIKNGYFAKQLRDTLVLPSFRDNFPDRYNPYYMHLTGQYILANDVSEVLTDDLTGEVLKDEDGNALKRTYSSHLTLKRGDGNKKTYRNMQVYTEFDEMMKVTSLDTYEEICFTKENLHGDPEHPGATVHRKTLEAYKVQGRYFDILCEKYPKQVDLIKSIVYLIPGKELSADEIELYDGSLPSADELRLQNAVDSEHLTLLQCDATILEERERESILSAIRSFLAFYKKRWDAKEFTCEEHYANVSWVAMFNMLIQVIKMQRLANIRTPHVHSSHVWSYLTSNGLESYKGYLTPEQEFFLYKNIRYLRANAGQHQVLNILVDRLLTENNLHLETKTVLMDTTGITEETDLSTVDIADQCKYCSRFNKTCFNANTLSRCDKIVPTSKLFKPEPVVLSENLYGAREQRIVERLQEKFKLTEDQAKQKLERSMIWKDSQVEAIRLELDRVQIVDLDGSIESLDELVKDEHACKLEPIYNSDVVDDQTVRLQHVKSTVIPTKLIEITEDRHSPRYLEYFQKFFADTIMQFAPTVKNAIATSRVLSNYKIGIDQGAVTISLSFGEAVALLYFNVLTLNKMNIKVTKEIEGSTTEEYITDFINDDFSLDFPIPRQSTPVMAFRLGAPVKQQDVLAAYSASDPELTQKYLSLAKIDDPEAKACVIRNSIYIITRSVVADDDLMWGEFGYKYTILGKFIGLADKPTYYSNDTDQIVIIPMYFDWFGHKLFIKTVRTFAELDSVKLEEADQLVAVWEEEHRGVYKKYGDKWVSIYTDSNDSQITFYKQTDGTAVRSLTAYEQNALNGALEPEKYRMKFITPEGDLTKSDGSLIDELQPYEGFAAFFNSTLAEQKVRCVLDAYLDIDWILENRYFDTLEPITEQIEFGKYLSRMFDMFVRLDVLRSTAGDSRTKFAVNHFLDLIVDRNVQKFRLVDISENLAPTFADWAGVDDELGEALRHIKNAAHRTDLMEALNNDLYIALTEGCDSPYNYNPTSGVKLNKLMQLVRSLSSYLINFINSGTDTGKSTELSHYSVETVKSCIKFTTAIKHDADGQIDNITGIPDLDGVLYIPTLDRYAKDGAVYYVYTHDPKTDSHSYTKVRDLVIGNKLPEGCYEQVDFHELLGAGSDVKIIATKTANNGWLYQFMSIEDGTLSGYFQSPEFSMYMDRLTKRVKLKYASTFTADDAYINHVTEE